MDPYSFNINTTSELRLRRHIREVLLPYARAHLTSDHVVFTETVIEDTLEYVPMADATSFLLPTEPLELLMSSMESLDLTPPVERWSTPLEYVRHLRKFFSPPPPPADLQTEKCWHEDDQYYLRLSSMCWPMSSPILSKRARRETPKLGNANSRTSIPSTESALIAFLDLECVSVQDIEVPIPPMDDVLDLRLQVDSATGVGVRPVLQSFLGPPINEKYVDCFENTPNMPEFLSCDSPPRCLPGLASPPLFPRVTRRSSTHRAVRNDAEIVVNSSVRVPDLASTLQAAMPELIPGEDGDLGGQHMEIVSGWTTLAFSSPPPPSLYPSDGSEFDGLWDVSPFGTPATSLVAAKMDEVEIPRVRKFGHKNMLPNEKINDRGTADLSTMANSPGFFITSFISAPTAMTQAPNPFTSRLGDVRYDMHSPRPLSPVQAASNSLLGQPPSVPEEQANRKTLPGLVNRVEDLEGHQFDDAVASIYASTPQDPLSYIREEKLDDKEFMLMDVPDLPPPTAHPKEPILYPEGMQCFVALKGEVGRPDATHYESSGFAPIAFLQPTKGTKPLALELSWRPFNFGKKVPTDEEVAGIAKPIQLEDEVPGYRDDKYGKTTHALLDLTAPPISAEDDQSTLILMVPRACKEFGTSPGPDRAEESDHVEFLLTQRERARAFSAKFAFDADAEVQDDTDARRDAPWSDTLAQRDFHRANEHQDLRSLFDPTSHPSQSRTDHGYSFDDPGTDIIDDNSGRFSTNGLSIPTLLLNPLQDDSLFYVDPYGVNENVNDRSLGENKENVPPWGVDNIQQAEQEPDPLVNQCDWKDYFQLPESQTTSFEPLSFVSQSQLPTTSDHFTSSKAPSVRPLTPSARRVECFDDDPVAITEREQTNSRPAKRQKLDNLVPPSSKDLFSTFMELRSQAISSRTLGHHPETRNDIPTPHQTPDVPEPLLPQVTPDDVYDSHTVHIPEHWIPAEAVHRYLASLTFIQKHAVVHELRSPQCRVVLVERYNLGGTDIIVDPDYGVLFIPLFALPADLQLAIDRISGESWRYLRLLIVFEAFPSGQGYSVDHARDNKSIPYAYTPPICKAIRKLRRNLGIAEGCGTMNSQCKVTWAFANDVEEAAKFVRCFGEEACAISMERGRGEIWDERAWLEEQEQEGELVLASVHGMNVFTAFVMLYDRSLETILDMAPEDRLTTFGQLLGKERVIGLNAIIENRMQQIVPDLVDSVADPGH